jgi:hypothetical protein
MDPATDMADQQERGDGAPLLGPAARAFGKWALVVYWIACSGVIAFGLSRMEWPWPPREAAPHAAVAARPAPVRTVAQVSPVVQRAVPAKATHPAPPVAERALDAEDEVAPEAWAIAAVLLSVAGLVGLVWRPWRRRGSRQFGRFSGRGRRLGSMRTGRSWGF